MITLKTIDAHAGGGPLRLVVDGFPAPRGRTMFDKCEWANRHADHLRRALMLEPRGHADMTGAVLTEPVAPGSHAGLLTMDADRYGLAAGHAIVAATTIALERGLLTIDTAAHAIVFDTPVGAIRVQAHLAADAPVDTPRIERVAYANVPAFVVQGGVDVPLPSRRVRADIAFGGVFFAIVDSESAGLPIVADRLPELRRLAAAIRDALNRTITVTHPTEPRVAGIDAVTFTGPANAASAHLRNVTIFGNQQVDRSASGTATAAVMAVVDAMGLLPADAPFVHESIIGTTIAGRLADRTVVGDYPAIIAELEASAWITGEHTFRVEDDDPFEEGFRI